jgi:hypothetical protein
MTDQSPDTGEVREPDEIPNVEAEEAIIDSPPPMPPRPNPENAQALSPDGPGLVLVVSPGTANANANPLCTTPKTKARVQAPAEANARAGELAAKAEEQTKSTQPAPAEKKQEHLDDSGLRSEGMRGEGVADAAGLEEDEEEEEEASEEDDDDDDEPKLKYARLTQHLGPVYRNGGMTSAFVVAGDKMVMGTHDGNIHVVQVPILQSLLVYKAHQNASVTSVSISPFPPPMPDLNSNMMLPEVVTRAVSITEPSRPGSSRTFESKTSTATTPRTPGASRGPRPPPSVPNTPSNNIHIATSSMDGTVCVQSLVDFKDVQLRNFGRPIQAVALSPEFKNDRTYLSGGLAGQLVLTVGAPRGKSTSTISGATAQAAAWFGSMVGTATGKDTVLHSGEGVINTIKWSLSGKYVVWLNEHGIKIMRTKLQLDSADVDDAWKRIGHIDRPQTEEWETMATVWKGRAEWIDEQALESDEDESSGGAPPGDVSASPATEKLRQQQQLAQKQVERLLVGWGGSIWIIHVHPGATGVGKDVGERSAGRAEIVKL